MSRFGRFGGSTVGKRAAVAAALIAAAGAVGAASPLGWPQEAGAKTDDDLLVITNDEETVARACKAGTNIEILGNENTVTLTGECGRVLVAGNKNTVSVEALAELSVPGNKNSVLWGRGVGGKDPKVSVLGSNNKVAKKK